MRMTHHEYSEDPEARATRMAGVADLARRMGDVDRQNGVDAAQRYLDRPRVAASPCLIAYAAVFIATIVVVALLIGRV